MVLIHHGTQEFCCYGGGAERGVFLVVGCVSSVLLPVSYEGTDAEGSSYIAP